MSTLEIPVAVPVDRLVEAIEHLPSQELDRGEKGLGQKTLYLAVQDKCLCPSQCELAIMRIAATIEDSP